MKSKNKKKAKTRQKANALTTRGNKTARGERLKKPKEERDATQKKNGWKGRKRERKWKEEVRPPPHCGFARSTREWRMKEEPLLSAQGRGVARRNHSKRKKEGFQSICLVSYSLILAFSLSFSILLRDLMYQVFLFLNSRMFVYLLALQPELYSPMQTCIYSPISDIWSFRLPPFNL